MKVSFKQIAIIGLLVLVAGFFIYRAFFMGGEEITTAEAMGRFTFQENLQGKYNEVVPIEMEITGKDVVKAELIFNDSVIKVWNNPSGKLTFDLDASYYGLGARPLVLQLTDKAGNVRTDERMFRVVSDVAPEQWTAEIVQSYPHQVASFTQGLEFNSGVLYESTGDPNHNGSTIVSKVNLKTGETIEKNGLDANYFGEGITVMNDKVYQITWREQKCFVYDKNSLQMKLKDFTYTGEGWGLCNDGKSIIMSDGSERIVFRNPETFQVERSIEVYDQSGPRTRLNELEYIDGMIYANVWMLDIVLVIDPNSGKVMAEIDASSLSAAGKGSGDVLNGIAQNQADKKIYMTGKYWPKLFEVRIKKEAA